MCIRDRFRGLRRTAGTRMELGAYRIRSFKRYSDTRPQILRGDIISRRRPTRCEWLRTSSTPETTGGRIIIWLKVKGKGPDSLRAFHVTPSRTGGVSYC